MSAERKGSSVRRQRSELWLVSSLTLATFLSSLVAFAFGPFLPAMARDLGATVALLGQIPALVALAAALLGLLVGPLADLVGYRLSLCLSMACLSASILGVGLAPTLALMVPAALIGAIGRASATPIAQAVVGTRLEGAARRRGLAWMTAGISGAIILGVPVLTTIESVAGWRSSFIVLSVLVAATVPLLARVLPSDEPRPCPGLTLRGLLEAYTPILRHRPTRGLIAAFLLSNAQGSGILITYLGAFMVERYGLTTQEIGWVYLAIGGGALAGSLATGGGLGTRPLRPLIVACRVGIGALTLATFLLPMSPLAAVGLFTVVLVLIAVANVATATLLTSESPAGRAATMTLNGSAAALGQAIGAGLGGVALALGGFQALGLLATALVLSSAVVVKLSARTTPQTRAV